VVTATSTPVCGAPRFEGDGVVRVFAATATHLAWAVDGRLSVLDRRTGTVTEVPTTLPAATGGAGQVDFLTAGDWIVVCAVRPMEADPSSRSAAVLYDTASGRTAALESEAFAAGDRLAWREGTAYRIATLRPA